MSCVPCPSPQPLPTSPVPSQGEGEIRCLTIVTAIVLLLVCAAPARADSVQLHRPRNCAKLRPHAEFRCASNQLRRAQRHQRHPSGRHSVGYWRWREQVAARWISHARYRISHPPIAHLALWLCIHNYEGSWDNADTGHNGHYGGLQMTSPWGAGVYYVYRADWLTPYEQMRKAELGYIASGYSTAWLYGQWAHADCIAAYA